MEKIWPVSDRFLATLNQSHVALGACDLLTNGLPAIPTIGRDWAGVEMTEASVTVAEGIVRRTATLTLVDVDRVLTPVTDVGLLLPGISEVRLWSGVQYWDATSAEILSGADTEYIPCFTGPITAADLSEYPVVKLTCSDRGWYLTVPFTSVYTPVASATLDDSILSLLAFKIRDGKLDTNIPASIYTTGLVVYDQGANPADKLTELATAAGWELYTDPMGTWQADTVSTDTTNDPVVEYTAGPGGGLIVANVNYDVQNVVNTWVVTGESSGTDVAVPYGKVTDDDPNSVTYVRTPADERPEFYSSPLLTTDAQCVLAAMTRRQKSGGLGGSVSAVVLPNPALERGDLIAVDDNGLVADTLIVDSFSFDVPSAAAMTVVTRTGAVSAPDA